MTFAEYCYGPLEDIADALNGDNPPSDPVILRMVLARVLREVIKLNEDRNP